MDLASYGPYWVLSARRVNSKLPFKLSRGSQMTRNVRNIPAFVAGYGPVRPFTGVDAVSRAITRCAVDVRTETTGRTKLLPDIVTALRECGVRDGAVLSFHHHLRNGDHVMNMVLDQAARLGLRDLKVAPSSIFPVHAPLVEHMKTGVVTGVYTGYVAGPVAEAISAGMLENPAVLQTHGGRARAIESGELTIDVAFVAAPTADDYGNINGVQGRSACGVLGYAEVDVRAARRVVVVTDNLVAYPACPAEITQDFVDFVVAVPEIGDATQIVSGSTQITEDPAGLEIARVAADIIHASGMLIDGFSFQTGAGGVSLAVAKYVEERMRSKNVRGSFAAGGVTGTIVEMLEEGLFQSIFDVQCFDLRAVRSYRENPLHQGMSASLYGNPCNRGAVVNRLDTMILGAAEVDLDFNVNVSTRSNGVLLGGSGGHADTAFGSKLAIVTTKLRAGKFAKIVENVTTVTTPGSTIDVVVTEAGVAVNPRRADLADRLATAGINVVPIARLHDLANADTQRPVSPASSGRIVALQQYRDGSVIDVLTKVASASQF
ncbi:citrate lyase subunit alpha [Paraburkholderia sediminicola]|uniref:citrate lyase subunit alpha n=1 Tax=Paraburkholderia sediminicola TaxID=458836 RepID=UPI0038BB5F27